MGRAFEYRKERKFKRWGAMSKAFTRIGKEIAMAVKEGGGDPAYNPRLRSAVQNAKAANMPKTNVENAIKRASSKDAEDYQEVVYEGYGPHGIAFVVETATDNTTRTVANLRVHFNRCNGSLGTSGSVDYMFSRKGTFRIKANGMDKEELELELIDYGLDELKEDEDDFIIYTPFSEYGTMQKYLEEKGIEVIATESQRIPSMTKTLTEEQVDDVIRLIDRLEDDEDVINVFHTMDMSE